MKDMERKTRHAPVYHSRSPAPDRRLYERYDVDVGAQLEYDRFATFRRRLLLYMTCCAILTYIYAQNQRAEGQPPDNEASQATATITSGWNPCSDSKYELERHDFAPRHGDVCRLKGGVSGLYTCPDGCDETGGPPPYCVNRSKNFKGGPCRVKDPDPKPEYRCDGGACILSAETSAERKFAKYFDHKCDDKCGDGFAGQLTDWIKNKQGCKTNLDCSLSGECLPDGSCKCDPWAQGVDCSYLNFAPVDKSRLGYLHPHYSSWGGTILQSSDGVYHMLVSEILCQKAGKIERCGLNNWETRSQIGWATAQNIEGPFERVRTVLEPEHHNPSLHKCPLTGHWHLYTISGATGPIERTVSTDEGRSWTNPLVVSPRQNPGPLLKEDGSTMLFYRHDNMEHLTQPTCSTEGISFQNCPIDGSCNPPTDIPVIDHTGEDPSIFTDHRGNYHMLFNALPYKCVPKFNQGGHAWSEDGVRWSEPRIGAFNTTIRFSDGTDIKCERRERPQMVVDDRGRPVALVSAVTGCPPGSDVPGNLKHYRGADDCFTLVQRMST